MKTTQRFAAVLLSFILLMQPAATGIHADELSPTEAPVVTETPTAEPVVTEAPTEAPAVTDAPTEEPVVTDAPTEAPVVTDAPTEEPVVTDTPTEEPMVTEAPTAEPVVTDAPTTAPVATEVPTETPVVTDAPTEAPTMDPALLTPATITLPIGGTTSTLSLHARDGVQLATVQVDGVGYLHMSLSAPGSITLLLNGTQIAFGSEINALVGTGIYDVSIVGDGSDTVMSYTVTTDWQAVTAGSATRNQAETLRLDGQENFGALTDAQQENWWHIDVSRDGFLLLETECDFQPLRLVLSNEKGDRELLVIDETLADNDKLEIDGVWLAAGEYDLCVSGKQNGVFSLTATFTAKSLPTAARTVARNTALTVDGTDVTAALTPESDLHTYTFTLAQPQQVTISASAYLDTMNLILYDATGTTLLGDGSAKRTGGSATSAHTHTIRQLLPAGTYRIQVEAAANGPYGVYQMQVTSVCTIEQVSLSATQLELGASITVSCSTLGRAPTTYLFELQQRQSSGDYTVVDTQRGGSTATFTPEAGYYVVRVETSDGATTASEYSDAFEVRASTPFIISSVVTDKTEIDLGESITVLSTFDGPLPIVQTIAQLYDSNNQPIVGATGSAEPLVLTPSTAGTYRVMLVATDGTNWLSKWGPTITVNAPEPLAITDARIPQQNVAVNTPLSIAYEVSGTPLQWIVEIYRDGERIDTLNFTDGELTFVPDAPGAYRAMLVITDGTQWTSAFTNTVQVNTTADALTIDAVTPDKTASVTGSPIRFDLTVSGGNAMTFTEFQFSKQGSDRVETVNGGAYAVFTPAEAGEYRVMAVVSDGTAWVAKYSSTVSVTGSAVRFAIDTITASDTTDATVGANMTLHASSEGGEATQYIFELYQDGVTPVQSIATDSDTVIMPLNTVGTFRVMVVATDGMNWTSKWGPTVSVTARGGLDISHVSASNSKPYFGDTVTFTPHFMGWLDVTRVIYEVYNAKTNAHLATYAGNDASFNLTPTDTAVTDYRVMVVATNGEGWASKWSDIIHFTMPETLDITSLTPNVNENGFYCKQPITFTANIANGRSFTYATYTVYRRDDSTGAEVKQAEYVNASTQFTFTPETSGQYRVMLVATDGFSWDALYSPWITVKPSIVYRAFLVGQGYTGTGYDLTGTIPDSMNMQKLMSLTTGTPYIVTRKSDLSASAILSGIRTAFAGATEDDVSLFFYSGHGSTGGLLVGADFATVSPAQLRATLDTIPGKKIIIVDACHSGGLIGKSTTQTAKAFVADFTGSFVSAFSAGSRSANDLAANNYYVITAAHSTEYSVEANLSDGSGNNARTGVFTYALTQGCGWNIFTQQASSRPADTNGDNLLTLNEVFTYTYNTALSINSAQNAQVYPANSSFTIFAY